ncbi:KUP/HAK/KT family potassium transporter [Pseudomonas sp. PDM10]|nr:KUP/HAK/KT family potassium transporter [Pseudomonas sp. PDM10]
MNPQPIAACREVLESTQYRGSVADIMITPAISVLSAVEGLQLALTESPFESSEIWGAGSASAGRNRPSNFAIAAFTHYPPPAYLPASCLLACIVRR